MGQKDEGSKFEQDAVVVNFKARHGTETQEHTGVTCLSTLCVCGGGGRQHFICEGSLFVTR